MSDFHCRSRRTSLAMTAVLWAAAACGEAPVPAVPAGRAEGTRPAPAAATREHTARVFDMGAAPLLDAPDRDAWQKPDEVVAALGLHAGDRVADVGCGTGYFTLRLLDAVGPTGHVLAIDIQQGMLDLLAERLTDDTRGRVTLRCSAPERPLEPNDAQDVVLCVNTLLEVPAADAPAFVRSMADGLAAGGRLTVIDWLPRRTPYGPPLAHRITPERIRELARAAGLDEAQSLDLLPMHAFLVFTKPR